MSRDRSAERLHRIVHHHRGRHERDFTYWLEHVVHWHALLVAVVALFAVGYVFFGQQPAMAHDVEAAAIRLSY